LRTFVIVRKQAALTSYTENQCFSLLLLCFIILFITSLAVISSVSSMKLLDVELG